MSHSIDSLLGQKVMPSSNIVPDPHRKRIGLFLPVIVEGRQENDCYLPVSESNEKSLFREIIKVSKVFYTVTSFRFPLFSQVGDANESKPSVDLPSVPINLIYLPRANELLQFDGQITLLSSPLHELISSSMDDRGKLDCPWLFRIANNSLKKKGYPLIIGSRYYTGENSALYYVCNGGTKHASEYFCPVDLVQYAPGADLLLSDAVGIDELDKNYSPCRVLKWKLHNDERDKLVLEQFM